MTPEVNQFLVSYTVVATRLLAAASVAPFLSNQILRGPTRFAFVLAWTIIIYPFFEPQMPPDLRTNLPLLIAVIVKELVLGVLLGFFASRAFYLALGVGYLIDTQRGANMASVIAPGTGEQTSPFGQMFEQILTALFFTGGGFLLFLAAVFDSYQFWPLFRFLPKFPESFPKLVLADADLLMRMTLVFAAPIVASLFIAEFGLGLVNRFAPSLNVFSLAMPVKSILAVLLLVFYLPFLFVWMSADLGGPGLLRFLRNLAP
jgi:type III secretion protein T